MSESIKFRWVPRHELEFENEALSDALASAQAEIAVLRAAAEIGLDMANASCILYGLLGKKIPKDLDDDTKKIKAALDAALKKGGA